MANRLRGDDFGRATAKKKAAFDNVIVAGNRDRSRDIAALAYGKEHRRPRG